MPLDGFRAAIRTLGSRMPPGSLVIVETTVPPGTTEKVVAPELAAALAARGLPADAIGLACAYERVMPGASYHDSIPRSYAGHTPAAADACEALPVAGDRRRGASALASAVNYRVRAREGAREQHRATIIAFMEEWGRFAEAVGDDLFSVISSIRRRQTHSNMRPGFGAGGYCPHEGPAARRRVGGRAAPPPDLQFPFSTLAVSVNQDMPMASLGKIEGAAPGGLDGAEDRADGGQLSRG